MFQNIEKYGGDLSKVYLAGHSAGGYLVSMLGLNKAYLAKYGIDPDKQIKALVPYSGQVITHFAQRQKQGIANLKNAASPLAQTDKIVMYGDGNSTKLVRDVMNSSNQIIEGMKESTGIDLTSLLAGFVGGKASAAASESKSE